MSDWKRWARSSITRSLAIAAPCAAMLLVLPGCIVEIETSAGHLGEDPEEEAAKNIRWLRDGIAPERSRTPSIAAS